MESTLTRTGESAVRGGQHRARLGLALVWSRYEPERLGEVILFPGDDQGRHGGFVGRGMVEGDPEILPLARVRPGSVHPTGSFRSPKISRRQLRVIPRGDDAVEVVNIGRGAIKINDRQVEAGEVGLGDLLEIDDRALFLCVRLPAVERLLLARAFDDFPFGGADGLGIVGESAESWALRSTLQLCARREGHVLIIGPSGTGKELVAAGLHRLSRRAARPLVARNAATIPATLIDAELFGNARNYPNPGMRERPGLIGEASGSTLFLDEIGELPLELQAHLLRVMDRGEYHRLGEAAARVADVRMIAATNRDEAELKHDLRARFALVIQTPGLEARREDIPLLARQILRELADARGSHAELEPQLSPTLVKHLLSRRYVSHVRELRELLGRSLLESTGSYLQVPSGASAAARQATLPPAEPVGMAGEGEPVTPACRDPLTGLTRSEVMAALEGCAWVHEDAWRALGLSSRHQLRRLLARLDIPPSPPRIEPGSLTPTEVRAALEQSGGSKTAAAQALGLSSRFQLLRLLKKMAIDEPER